MTQERRLTETELTDMLRRAGVRPSVHRIAILKEIANGGRHPSADEIFSNLAERYPSMSRTTVYNSLHALTASALVRELEIESGCMRYDLAPQPAHSHFRCTRCGRILDMPLPPSLAETVAPGYTVDSVELTFRGVCPQCKEKETETLNH